LLSRINPKSFEKLFSVVLKWLKNYSSGKLLKLAAAQVTGLGAEAKPKGFGVLKRPIFEQLLHILNENVDEKGDDDEDDESWALFLSFTFGRT